MKLILTNPHYVGDLVQGRTTTVSVTSKKRENKTEMICISSKIPMNPSFHGICLK
ncbi:recombinase family protein [Bacillus atrophaeus]|uniref:recombinase family protein n=1 Tax=Bacillus atrophaeus TaxID=1452 RepID=UPI001C117387|nr:recombinase family protein [Bacillus atrophaeus]